MKTVAGLDGDSGTAAIVGLILRFGVGAAFAAYLIWYMTGRQTVDMQALQASIKENSQNISANRLILDNIRRDMNDARVSMEAFAYREETAQSLLTLYLRAICVNTAGTDAQRLQCVTLVTHTPPKPK